MIQKICTPNKLLSYYPVSEVYQGDALAQMSYRNKDEKRSPKLLRRQEMCMEFE